MIVFPTRKENISSSLGHLAGQSVCLKCPINDLNLNGAEEKAVGAWWELHQGQMTAAAAWSVHLEALLWL